MKQEEIYVTVPPYYSMPLQCKPICKIIQDSHSFHGLLFFEPEVKEADKNWLKDLLKSVNFYTGIA